MGYLTLKNLIKEYYLSFEFKSLRDETKQQYQYEVEKLKQEASLREQRLQEEIQKVKSTTFQAQTKQKNEDAIRIQKLNEDLKKAKSDDNRG